MKISIELSKHHFRYPSILLVDDDDDDILLFKEAMPDEQGLVNIVVAKDGKEALDYLAGGHSPTITFLDINMPRMNGLECLTKLNEHGLLAKTSVLLISTSGNSFCIEQARKLGAKAYIKKPANFVSWQIIIHEVLNIDWKNTAMFKVY